MTRDEMRRATNDMLATLPAEPQWDDLMYRVYIRQKIDEGIADSTADRVLSVEEARAHFRDRS